VSSRSPWEPFDMARCGSDGTEVGKQDRSVEPDCQRKKGGMLHQPQLMEYTTRTVADTVCVPTEMGVGTELTEASAADAKVPYDDG